MCVTTPESFTPSATPRTVQKQNFKFLTKGDFRPQIEISFRSAAENLKFIEILHGFHIENVSASGSVSSPEMLAGGLILNKLSDLEKINVRTSDLKLNCLVLTRIDIIGKHFTS